MHKLGALLTLLLGLLALQPNAQERPKPTREFRAVWIATVDNIDFPSRKGLPIEDQKRELLACLDLAKKMRLNAVIFQVRPMADAIYRSSLEPWSEFLTGEMGKSQDFDPLEFVVAEAHKRGVLVHAWFNPYRAYHPSARTMSNDHVARRKPTTVRQYGRNMWLDPTSPEAQRHSLEVIQDVVRRYDVDGVHFDDYFYPYKENDAAGNEIDFPDDSNWRAYQNAGGKLARDDWRRSNVNLFIETVGRAIKQIKPDIVYGISPFGIWRPQPEKGISGFDSYAKLYSDSKKWLQDGTVDYLAPQLYWETSRQGLSFPVLLDWWKQQNTKKRFVWPGVAAYRIGSTSTFTTGEIASQIEHTRLSVETSGALFFSFKSLRNDMGGIQGVLRDEVYQRDAIIPEFTWIKSRTPLAPKMVISRNKDFVRANWTERGKRKAFWFVVYAKGKDGWSSTVLPSSERSISLSADRKIEKIVVTSVDRLGRESLQ
ncbi:MAG: family 10 glycosylhydrolase [Acidobacteriota bacterium]